MKKLLTIILLLILAGGIGFAVWHSIEKNQAIERETSDFVTETIGAITESWNPHALTSRAEPGLIKAMTVQGQSIDDLFRVYRNLGSPSAAAECAVKNTTQFETSKGIVRITQATPARPTLKKPMQPSSSPCVAQMLTRTGKYIISMSAHLLCRSRVPAD